MYALKLEKLTRNRTGATKLDDAGTESVLTRQEARRPRIGGLVRELSELRHELSPLPLERLRGANLPGYPGRDVPFSMLPFASRLLFKIIY